MIVKGLQVSWHVYHWVEGESSVDDIYIYLYFFNERQCQDKIYMIYIKMFHT